VHAPRAGGPEWARLAVAGPWSGAAQPRERVPEVRVSAISGDVEPEEAGGVRAIDGVAVNGEEREDTARAHRKLHELPAGPQLERAEKRELRVFRWPQRAGDTASSSGCRCLSLSCT